MSKISNKLNVVETIAETADRGQDISVHFTNQFTVVRPVVPRVNVYLTKPMPQELDREIESVNVGGRAVRERGLDAKAKLQ